VTIDRLCRRFHKFRLQISRERSILTDKRSLYSRHIPTMTTGRKISEEQLANTRCRAQHPRSSCFINTEHIAGCCHMADNARHKYMVSDWLIFIIFFCVSDMDLDKSVLNFLSCDHFPIILVRNLQIFTEIYPTKINTCMAISKMK